MAGARATLKVAPRGEFGSRTSRRLRRAGFVPGVVYSGGSEARAFQVVEREVQTVLAGGARPLRPRDRGLQNGAGRGQGAAAAPGARQSPAHRSAGGEARRGDPGRGRDRAGGHRDGSRGQRRRRARARHPRDHGRSAAHRDPRPDRRRRLGDGDQRHASAFNRRPPQGVTFTADDPEEVTIATLSPPRVEEEPEPELEEETELVGEEGEAPSEEAAGDGEGGDSGDSDGE